ncbi:hypothetical protein D9619_010094 [Psilocybe cf. subviscida]|uniref:Uncharacterized protein n=1 Tax=Psilocybe cf. subviscida TaxID=2480587 RepID=A0A8H5BKX9_9AGAR|nr:hypothetical protein D9619_010094 [Psilocybe cf. subviscida]
MIKHQPASFRFRSSLLSSSPSLLCLSARRIPRHTLSHPPHLGHLHAHAPPLLHIYHDLPYDPHYDPPPVNKHHYAHDLRYAPLPSGVGGQSPAPGTLAHREMPTVAPNGTAVWRPNGGAEYNSVVGGCEYPSYMNPMGAGRGASVCL